MACDNITDILVRESGRFGTDIYKRIFKRSPWVTLVKRGVFPAAMGETISVLTYERSAPTDAEPTWSDVAVVDQAEGGACLPPATKVAIGSRTRSYNLKRRVLEGPDFCAEEARTVFALADQLNAITDILAQYTMIEWEIRDRHEYFRNTKHKVVIDSCTPTMTSTSATTYPAVCPTGTLNQGVLNLLRQKLIRDGAADSAMGVMDGSPVLTAIMSAETSDRIIFENADIRQDLRWGKPSELLAAMGVERSYRGYFHLIDPYPRRFSCEGGVYTEVPAFATTAVTKGNSAEVNPNWEAIATAPFEETFIFDPEVFHQLIPEPITNPASNFRFDPITYTGDWKVKNIPDRVCNPDNNILYHRGVLAAASKPVHPERGMSIIHRRCAPPCSLLTSCS